MPRSWTKKNATAAIPTPGDEPRPVVAEEHWLLGQHSNDQVEQQGHQANAGVTQGQAQQLFLPDLVARAA